jgi:hypothetical protein
MSFTKSTLRNAQMISAPCGKAKLSATLSTQLSIDRPTMSFHVLLDGKIASARITPEMATSVVSSFSAWG